MSEQPDAADRLRGVHFAHCHQGDYRNSCKYGDAACPALAGAAPDHPSDRSLDPEDRAVALARWLARNEHPDQIALAIAWAGQITEDMEN